MHLPLNRNLKVLITRDGIRTARWYFEDSSPFPVAVDVNYSSELDEARLILDDWQSNSGLPAPGRIGVVSSSSEEITWLKVDAVSVRKQ